MDLMAGIAKWTDQRVPNVFRRWRGLLPSVLPRGTADESSGHAIFEPGATIRVRRRRIGRASRSILGLRRQ